jgi:branched-chain amino acid transport system ATP-binding protein
MSAPLLKVSGVDAWYGESHILHGIDFEVREGELVTLLGQGVKVESVTDADQVELALGQQ